MAFPRAPKKPVTGRLRLVVKSPTSVTVGEEPTEEFVDLSDQLTFKVPRGFQIETDPGALIDKQLKVALVHLDRIKEKREACRNCENLVEVEALGTAYKLVSYAATYFSTNSDTSVSFSVSQKTTGQIVVQYKTGSKLLVALPLTASISIGSYQNDTRVSEGDFTISSPDLVACFYWLIKDDHER